jgi:PTH1 family peptidyl-tRNA hydrolase
MNEIEQYPRLVVGLGNPGKEYVNTRHNIGFMVIDELLADSSVSIFKSQKNLDSWIWRGALGNQDILLQKPLSYMNLSGDVIAKLCDRCDISPRQVLVVYDDVDLPLGSLRLRQQGGSGGHRGILSLISALKCKNFNRLRIGIQGSERDHIDTAEYVLSNFNLIEEPLLKNVLKSARDAVMMSIRSGMVVAMNHFNKLDNLNHKIKTRS